MKKITTFLGCVGVVCLFWGCSSDSDLLSPGATLADEPAITPANDTPATLSSSSVQTPTSSDAGTVAPDGTNPNPGKPTEVKHDTVTKTVIIQQDPNLGDTPTPNYRQDEVFCWTDECRAKYAGMTSNPEIQSSSSISIDISMSQEAQVPPTKSGNTLTDNRDNNTYPLETIDGTTWMSENLRYRTEVGSYCQNSEGDDVCTKNKSVYYTYAVAQRVCPMGWRLPTQAEVEAAATSKPDSWWTIGGRFKISDDGGEVTFGLDDGQGYIWIIQSGNYTSWRIKSYSGDSVEKDFQSSEGPRAYNVRCVEGTLE